MRIFISYRRADTSEEAHAIYRFLARKYRKSNVFIDVDAIPKGSDFQTELKSALSKTDVLLAMIGERWLEPAEGSATPRLFEEGDFVRMEIAQAVGRGIPVVPVVVGDAPMTALSQLPKDIVRVRRNRSFHFDKGTLKEDCSRLDGWLRRLRPRHRPWRWLVYSAGANVLMLGLLLPMLLVPTASVQSEREPDLYRQPVGRPISVTVTADGRLLVPNNLPFDMKAALKERRGSSSYAISMKAEKEASMKSVASIAYALRDSFFATHIDVSADRR
jgi:hypothetical protein